MRLRALIGIAVLVLPSVSLAQRVGGIGPFGRGNSIPGKLKREPGVEIPKVVNSVNLLVEHRRELALSDTQFVRILAVKRALDSTNAPLMRRADSVARLFKGGPIFSQPTAERRDSIASGRAVVNETIAEINENIADGREKTYGLLSSSQLAKAEQIEEEARKAGASPGRGRL